MRFDYKCVIGGWKDDLWVRRSLAGEAPTQEVDVGARADCLNSILAGRRERRLERERLGVHLREELGGDEARHDGFARGALEEALAHNLRRLALYHELRVVHSLRLRSLHAPLTHLLCVLVNRCKVRALRAHPPRLHREPLRVRMRRSHGLLLLHRLRSCRGGGAWRGAGARGSCDFSSRHVRLLRQGPLLPLRQRLDVDVDRGSNLDDPVSPPALHSDGAVAQTLHCFDDVARVPHVAQKVVQKRRASGRSLHLARQDVAAEGTLNLNHRLLFQY
mmetsp:Transcript_16957/g.55473  ORF Transcript_16957/g.55473 Transcript_16957/m.55473 type:complete len:276 (-) Transcript_16957:471-1298(-)